MRRIARLSASAAALGLILSLVFVPAASANTPPVQPPPGSNARQFMLNVLGSVLGPFAPESWKREQIAYNQRYNFGWETLDRQFGTNSANPDYLGQPDSYEDYVIRKAELDMSGGTNGQRMAAPATKPSKLQKGVAGVGAGVVALTSFPIGTMIGNGVSNMLGLDVDGLVCGADESGFLSLLTGASCDSLALDGDYVVNSDAAGGVLGERICHPEFTASCVTVSGSVVQSLGFYFEPLWCIQTEGDLQPLLMLYGDGSALREPSTYFGAPGMFGCSETQPFGPTSPVSPYFNTEVEVVAALSLVEEYCFRSAGASTCLDASPRGGFVEAGSDPERTISCAITGDNGETYTATSESYRESDGEVATPVCPQLPDGVRPENVTLTEDGNGAPKVLQDEDVTPEYAEWWDDYPECRTGACKLDLKVKTGGVIGASCFDLADQCADWFTSPTKADDYQCVYGIHSVDLSECNAYSGLWQPGRITGGAPYSDPLTGDWSGGTNAPSPDRQALAQTLQDPALQRACNGMAAPSFDPVAWVMRPIQCALEWAFVPRPAVVQVELAATTEAWSSGFFGQVGGLVAPFAELPMIDGCEGVPVLVEYEWPIEWKIDWTFGNACDEPLSGIADIVRSVLAVGIILLGIRSFTRYMGGVIGYRGFGSGGGV